jgi:uncharacterized protein (TIGR02996 family)
MSTTRKIVKVRFENVRAPETYWREITLDGVKLFVDAGRTNTMTNETHRFERSGERFATAGEAQARFDDLVAAAGNNFKSQRRTEEELPARVDGLGPSASNPELEARLLTHPDDAQAAAVYADWLQTHGDPRGELAALFQGGKSAEAEAWLAANPDRLFGELDVRLDTEVNDLVWTHGFLRGATLKRLNFDSRTDLAALTRALLALPVARFVTALRFGLASYESDNDWGPTMAAVAASAQAARVRSLRFDDYTYEDCEISWTPFGDFSPYWDRVPALEELHIRSGAGGTLGDVALPSLRTLIRESGGLSAAEITSIMNARLPRLERLDVWTGSSDYGAEATVEHFQPLLEGRLFPTLTHFGLVNSELGPDLLVPLATSPLLRRLRVLDLSKGVLGDEHVAVLVERADAFRHLERLDLSENCFSDERLAAELTSRLPNAVVADQREGETTEDRYVAVGE